MKIFLVGYMASGKSVVGEQLAQLLNYRFVDTDLWIEARSCKTIPQIFTEDGEDNFRAKEKECLEFLMDQENLVVATGGGTPCYHQAMEFMSELGETVYLKANLQTLAARLWDEKSDRPKLNSCKSREQLMDFISEHLFQREMVYEKCIHSVSVDGKSVEQIAQEIKYLLI
jgi:shikimate kinase